MKPPHKFPAEPRKRASRSASSARGGFTPSSAGKPKRLQRLCHAWAIKRTYTDIDGKVYVGFVGPYYGNTEPVSKPLPMAMFATRREAREHQKTHWGRKDYLGDRERCRVVPVQITVIEQ